MDRVANITGISLMFSDTRMASKRLGLLHELVPKASVMGISAGKPGLCGKCGPSAEAGTGKPRARAYLNPTELEIEKARTGPTRSARRLKTLSDGEAALTACL